MPDLHLPDPTEGYADESRPLAPYLALTTAFNAAFATVLWRSGRLPRVKLGDVVLLGAATHQATRLLSRRKATSFLRAPFVRYRGPAGRGEVEETPRGSGMQRAVGELVVCPYCLAQWVGGAFVAGLALSPQRTRLVAGMFATVAVADALQIARRTAEERA